MQVFFPEDRGGGKSVNRYSIFSCPSKAWKFMPIKPVSGQEARFFNPASGMCPILESMIGNWIHKISSLKAVGWLRKRRLGAGYTLFNLRMRLGNFWTLTDRGAWIFAGVLGVGVITLGTLIYTAVDGKVDHRDLDCLARNIYYEARGEPENGQQAVAKVTLNRVQSSRFPNSICEVVYEQRWDKRRKRYVGAFAWTELDHLPKLKRREWQKAWKTAEGVYENPESVQLGGALFYHAARIKPRWAKQKKRTRKIGHHIFYR